MRKMLSEGDNSAILGHYSSTLSPEGLFFKMVSGEERLNWSAIKKISQNEDYIFLYIGAMNAVIVPKRAFATPQEQQNFLAIIHTHCQPLAKTN
jgi:hypothetical protein